ncbi:hypothetical protein [Marinilabilia rubra]|uniref:Uncharacterized protein n=1 Tax=Marinilabilia rubra TaxID=2162893 RepID=A0A2U2B7L3_9BACT|nr:hypothetical protein [Marinilabilia rubra]PWD99033.1 hypothetical protein DDZ16_12265 [Marinilabilia rubra]
MKSKLIIPVIFICLSAALLLVLTPTGDDDQLTKAKTDLLPDKANLKEDIKSSIGHIAVNIASPAELATSIKSAGGAFSRNILLNTDVDKYITPKDKALALGGIGVDLVYINLFENRSATIVPLNQIRKLSNDLYLSQYFDFESLKKLATTSLTKKEMDSLALMTNVRLNSIEEQMLKPGRAETGIFMIIGAWAEGLFLLTHYAQNSDSKEIIDKVAEQQISFKELLKWLDKFQHIKEVNEILKEIKPLKKEVLSAQIKYEKIGPPINTVDIDGNEISYRQEISIAVIDSTQLSNIARESAKFRNKIFKLN